MKRFIAVVALLCAGQFVFGQTIEPDVYATSGSVYSGSNAQLSWTMGETMIASFNTGSVQLTEGFQQPNLVITALDNPVDLQVEVFPNPTMEDLFIQFPPESGTDFRLELINVSGQVLLNELVIEGEIRHELDMENISQGTYFLRVISENNQHVQSFKVQKL